MILVLFFIAKKYINIVFYQEKEMNFVFLSKQLCKRGVTAHNRLKTIFKTINMNCGNVRCKSNLCSAFIVILDVYA